MVRAAGRRFGAGATQQAERLASGEARQSAEGRHGLLGLLTTARDADGSGLSEPEIRDEISTFLVAGHQTTAMALTWSLALLSADPGQLPRTTEVVSEAMRLYLPAWTLERTALAGDDVCGTPVPAGSMVAVLPYLVHRNPAVWPNPSGFDPGRFLPGAIERHRYAWIPFWAGNGAAPTPASPGRRRCWFSPGCAATTGST